jgi:hypothetical protein
LEIYLDIKVRRAFFQTDILDSIPAFSPRHLTLGYYASHDDIIVGREEDCFYLVKREISFIHF